MSRPPTILAFDTSSSLCVCGVTRGVEVVSAIVSDTPGAPSEGLLPMIHVCLEEAGLGPRDLDALAPGRGPGSFTGTRIALATAKGIALGSGIPIVAASSTEAAAIDTGWKAGPVAVALDARRGEILLAAYRLEERRVDLAGAAWPVTTASCLLAPGLVRPEDVARRLEAHGGRTRVVGDGPAAWPAAFEAGDLDLARPDGPLISDPRSLAFQAIVRMGRGESDDPDGLEPVYSRPPPVHRGSSD